MRLSIQIFLSLLSVASCVGNVEMTPAEGQNGGSTTQPIPPAAPTGIPPSSSQAPALSSIISPNQTDAAVTISKPIVSTSSNLGLTITAYIGIKSLVTVNNGMVFNYIQGPIDVSASGTTFSNLSTGGEYRIVVLAKNNYGFSAEFLDIEILSIFNNWFCYAYGSGYPAKRDFGQSINFIGTTSVSEGNGTVPTYNVVSVDYALKKMVVRSIQNNGYYTASWSNLGRESMYFSSFGFSSHVLSEAVAQPGAATPYYCVATPQTGKLYTYCPGTNNVKDTFVYANKLRNGITTTHNCDAGYKDGDIPYLNDKIEGTAIYYCSNGTVSGEIPHRQGAWHGLLKYYSCPIGKLQYSVGYSGGVVHGYSTYYCPNGVSMSSRFTYNMGVGVNFESWTCP